MSQEGPVFSVEEAESWVMFLLRIEILVPFLLDFRIRLPFFYIDRIVK